MDPTGRVRRIVTWLALAASLGAGLLFVVVRGTVPSDGARVAFYGDGWSAAGFRIAPLDAPAAGLEVQSALQSVFVSLRADLPAIAALHPLNGFAILVVAGWLMRASWAVRREPAPAPAAAAIGASAMSSEIG